MTAFGRAALAYASRFGWRVFPLAPRGKEPLIPKWKGGKGVYDATNEQSIIRSWWTQCPDANIGLACGFGWFAVDVDPRNGGDDTLAALESKHGTLPETPMQLTGSGGQHLLFRAPEGERLKGSLGEGIDIKSSGGYIVAAPSVHPSGKAYAWDAGLHPTDVAIAAPPDWMIRELVRPSKLHSGPPTGKAAESFLAIAFGAMGWLGDALNDGAVCVTCPWAEKHSDKRGDGRDSSTIIFAPTERHPLGKFFCHHSHIEGRRVKDVLAMLSNQALALGAKRNPKLANLVLLYLRGAAA